MREPLRHNVPILRLPVVPRVPPRHIVLLVPLLKLAPVPLRPRLIVRPLLRQREQGVFLLRRVLPRLKKKVAQPPLVLPLVQPPLHVLVPPFVFRPPVKVRRPRRRFVEPRCVRCFTKRPSRHFVRRKRCVP